MGKYPIDYATNFITPSITWALYVSILNWWGWCRSRVHPQVGDVWSDCGSTYGSRSRMVWVTELDTGGVSGSQTYGYWSLTIHTRDYRSIISPASTSPPHFLLVCCATVLGGAIWSYDKAIRCWGATLVWYGIAERALCLSLGSAYTSLCWRKERKKFSRRHYTGRT